MDKRELKTRQAVFDAISELLMEMDFESITVSDILKRSKISRSTFYAHFCKKEDVIHELCDELFHHVLSPDLKKENGHDFSSYSMFEYKHLLTHLLFHIQEEKRFVKGINSGSAKAMFYDVLREKLNPLMDACVRSKTFYRQGIDETLQRKLFVETFLVIMDDWIEHDCEQSPLYTADIYYRFITESTIK